MENQRNGPRRDSELNDELVEVLTAIGVVARQLAAKIKAMNIGEKEKWKQMK